MTDLSTQDQALIDKLLVGTTADRTVSNLKSILKNQLLHTKQFMQRPENKFSTINLERTLQIAKEVFLELETLNPIVGIQAMGSPNARVFSMQYRTDLYPDHPERIALAILAYDVAATISTNVLLYEDDEVASVEQVVGRNLQAEVIARLRSTSEAHTISIHDPNIRYTINAEAINIGAQTKRGCGNVLLVGNMAYQELKQRHPDFQECVHTLAPGMVKVGTINNGLISVYTHHAMHENEMILAYKGGGGDTDAACIVAPYIMIDHNETKPSIIATQWAIWSMTKDEHTTIDASNYYKRFVLV